MLQDKSDANINIKHSVSILDSYAESNLLLDAIDNQEKIELRPPPNKYYIESSQQMPMAQN